MLEEYLKIFNDYLEVHDINGAINYLDKIFIDSKYLRVKNLFLYLLGCITKLPDKYLDYTKTIFNYDLIIPAKNININEARIFLKNVLFHNFLKATNIYYEYMENSYSPECKRAILNLLHLAVGVKKITNNILIDFAKDNDYYNLNAYVSGLVYNHPTYNNIYILYLLLQDYLSKDYFNNTNNYNYKTLVEQVRHKNYNQVLAYYQNISYNEENNYEITIILNVLKNIIYEKENMSAPVINEDKKTQTLDKDMFLDFLDSIEDIIEKEGFAILNPEYNEINKEMRDLAFYLPNLASYEIGDNEKQVVINMRKNNSIIYDNSIFALKKNLYNNGDNFAYIDYALEHLKYIIPSEMDAAKLAQSYFRVGLIDEGLRALNLAIGIKKYDNNTVYSSNMLNYYMMQDYFKKKKEKSLARSRQI